MLTTLALPTCLDKANIDFTGCYSEVASSETADIQITKNHTGQLTLRHKNLSLCIDLTAGNYRHRQQHVGKEPLLNALKIKGKLPKCVFDATPGVLKDTWLMASKGIDVIACERHPIVALLQYHALKYAQENSDVAHITKNIHWQYADARTLLTDKLLNKHRIDSIYLDPMFPHSPNSAAVKKDLQMLQHLVGKDADSETLLTTALAASQHAGNAVRIVVKRPPHASPLANRQPSYESKTGKTRFDVYLQ